MSYDYGENIGPHTWAIHFPAAGGKRQSPINICNNSAVFDKNLHPLSIDLKKIEHESLIMKAHNFQVSIAGLGVLKGGPLPDEYHLKQFHFHWGSGDTWGSEHQVDGIYFSGELHLVFEKSPDSKTESDSICVVGVFMKVGDRPNRALDMILESLVNIKVGEERKVPKSIPISALLPDDLSKYYTYPGSLTTPPCSECVTWIVLRDAITVTSTQLNGLRKLHAHCAECGRTDNYRPVCPIGKRCIRRSFE